MVTLYNIAGTIWNPNNPNNPYNPCAACFGFGHLWIHKTQVQSSPIRGHGELFGLQISQAQHYYQSAWKLQKPPKNNCLQAAAPSHVPCIKQVEGAGPVPQWYTATASKWCNVANFYIPMLVCLVLEKDCSKTLRLKGNRSRPWSIGGCKILALECAVLCLRWIYPLVI
jgi:hypothetical protein